MFLKIYLCDRQKRDQNWPGTDGMVAESQVGERQRSAPLSLPSQPFRTRSIGRWAHCSLEFSTRGDGAIFDLRWDKELPRHDTSNILRRENQISETKSFPLFCLDTRNFYYTCLCKNY